MVIMIDAIAERYGMLPSRVLRQATTFDMFVCETAISYKNHQIDKAYGKTKEFNPDDYSQTDLLKILKESKGELDESN